ncbi:hypothetical protein BDZ91DRAFT_731358 [Kalaharituber pfeilii]|nr:hypothetical protein BDZ91DRAFT_731358 [Kalaharituber pfeilii]
MRCKRAPVCYQDNPNGNTTGISFLTPMPHVNRMYLSFIRTLCGYFSDFWVLSFAPVWSLTTHWDHY